MFDWREHPWIAGTIAVITIGLAFYASDLAKKKNEEAQRAAEGMVDGEAPPPSDASDRIASARRQLYSQPSETLKTLSEIRSQPHKAEEKKQAEELLPQAYNNVFHKLLREKQFETAYKILGEFESEFPKDPLLPSLRHAWSQSLGQRCQEAARARDDAQVRLLLTQIGEQGKPPVDRHVLDAVQGHYVQSWRQARAAGDTAKAQTSLLDAAQVLPSLYQSPLVRALEESDMPGAECHSLAEAWIAEGKKAQAIPFLSATYMKIKRRGVEGYQKDPALDGAALQEIESKVQSQWVDAIMEFGSTLSTGKPPVLCSFSPKELYVEAVLQVQQAGLRARLYRRIMQDQLRELEVAMQPLRAHDIRRLADPDYLSYDELVKATDAFHKARGAAMEILDRSARATWSAQVEDPSFDPWPLVPPEVAASVHTAYPREDQETDRRRELIRRTPEQYAIPLIETKEARDQLYEIHGRWGLLQSRQPNDETWRMLRSAIRGTGDPEFKRLLIEALQNAIRKAQSQGKFDVLYALSGFYASEIGLSGPRDPFANDFRASLQSAATQFEKTSPMKHVFMLSLLADSFPQEETGKITRAQVLERGFQLAPNASAKPENPIKTPSNLPQLSIVKIDNKTEYHLLCFYKGPESFYVRCSPFRRGSLVLKDGIYEVAVISPSDEVIPYRTQNTFASEMSESTYTIKSSGNASSSTPSLAEAHGDYTLFRAPENAGTFQVDPKKGTVTVAATPSTTAAVP